MSGYHQPAEHASWGRFSVWLAVLGVIGLVAAATLLWARNGTAVFVEMLIAGVMSCF
jgi:hypothetical protein